MTRRPPGLSSQVRAPRPRSQGQDRGLGGPLDQATAGLEQSVGLTDEIALVEGIANAFHAVDSVELALRQTGIGITALDKAHLLRQTAFARQALGMGQLLGGDVDTRDIGATLLGHPDAGSADAAACIHQPMARLHGQVPGHLSIHVQDGGIVPRVFSVVIAIVQPQVAERAPYHLVIDVTFPVIIQDGLLLGIHTVFRSSVK